ncbi:hypothetical protein IX326_001891 [Porphyromonas levii]|nr:hypothetical protein [Porphyromonas levii]
MPKGEKVRDILFKLTSTQWQLNTFDLVLFQSYFLSFTLSNASFINIV